MTEIFVSLKVNRFSNLDLTNNSVDSAITLFVGVQKEDVANIPRFMTLNQDFIMLDFTQRYEKEDMIIFVSFIEKTIYLNPTVKNYPLDSHLLKINVYFRGDQERGLHYKITKPVLKGKFSLIDEKADCLNEYTVIMVEAKSSAILKPDLDLTITFKRDVNKILLISLVFLLLFLTAISFLPFWFEADKLTGVSFMLACLLAQFFQLQTILDRVPLTADWKYIDLLMAFTLLCTAFCISIYVFL